MDFALISRSYGSSFSHEELMARLLLSGPTYEPRARRTHWMHDLEEECVAHGFRVLRAL